MAAETENPVAEEKVNAAANTLSLSAEWKTRLKWGAVVLGVALVVYLVYKYVKK